MDLQNETFELLEATKTNWTVNKEPLVTESGLITESYGIFRNDNSKWLGTVGKQYEAIQNFEVAEILIATTESFSEQHRGGLLIGGKKVYYQARVNPEHVANDTVERYVTLLNSHDGSSGIGFGFTNKVVSCQNTFHHAMRDLRKFKHTGTAKERLAIAQLQVREVLKAENYVIEKFKRMADEKVTDKAKKLIIANLFDIKDDDFGKSTEEFSTRKINDMAKFKNIMDSELASHGETLWGLFNAVTYKTNHLDAKKNNQLENVMVGSGYKKNNDAFRILAELV
jgi:phage/plasmid-like protein (TIGR03299 family)